MHDNVKKAVEALKDDTLRQNAQNLIEQMEGTIEGIGDEEIQWRPPILKVVQQMSDTDALPDGAKAGSMVVEDHFVEQQTPVIPLRVWYSRTYWHPDPDQNQILCSSPDAQHGFRYGNCKQCEFAKFVEGEGSACNKAVNVICVTADLSEVFICTFAKTQYAQGMDWVKMMKKAKTQPYKKIYDIGTENNPKNKKVKTLAAHPSKEEGLSQDVLDFVGALFDQVSEDREESLRQFYENLKRREEQQHLGNDSSEDRMLTVEEGKASNSNDDQDDDAPEYVV